MTIVETERLVLREITADDAAFIYELLNTPKFLRYIGDRGVRSVDEAAVFLEDRYRRSYRDHGYGLYTVERKSDGAAIGLCGFVRRPDLAGPDIGFAFLPGYERQGFGHESASAMMQYGWGTLGFSRVLAITSLDNGPSRKLLERLGFAFERTIELGGETLKLFGSSKTQL